jgi:hypothetical protein
MTRLKRPGIKVLFAAFREVQVYTEGLGGFPLYTGELLETVGKACLMMPSARNWSANCRTRAG